ncbi:hypothetical protein RhiJN_18028 [Ceratobasidium sp. AG-Ba]|nr:hypothetical protein RhiJN_18028 [Ceratobasidium sp. AG-Ba]
MFDAPSTWLQSSIMHLLLFAATIGSLIVQPVTGVPTVVPRAALKALVGNDDGWAEANIRALYQVLSIAGYNVCKNSPQARPIFALLRVLDRPIRTRQNESGTGSSDEPARLNYVNSYPVTAIKYGTTTLALNFFGGASDIFVAGPNVGNNLGSTTSISGTVGAATEAVKEGIPSIAFGGKSGSARSYATLKSGDASYTYAQISQKLLATLTASAKPWLPAGVDVVTCNNGGHLPDETTVLGTSGKCYVTVSAFLASNKHDANTLQQAAVLSKFSSVPTCL